MLLSKWLDSELREKHEFLTYAVLGCIAVVHIYGITDLLGWRLDYLLGVTIFGLITGGFAWIVGLPLLELTGGDGLYYTLWAHGPMAAFFFVLWLGSKFESDKSASSPSSPARKTPVKKKADAVDSGKRWDNPWTVRGDAFDPEVTRTPRTNTRTVVDSSDYDKWVQPGYGATDNLKGLVGPKTTNHEQMFWNQLR